MGRVSRKVSCSARAMSWPCFDSGLVFSPSDELAVSRRRSRVQSERCVGRVSTQVSCTVRTMSWPCLDTGLVFSPSDELAVSRRRSRVQSER